MDPPAGGASTMWWVEWSLVGAIWLESWVSIGVPVPDVRPATRHWVDRTEWCGRL